MTERPLSYAISRAAPKAGARMVVHHADGLQKGIDDGRADEAEAALAEVLGDAVAEERACRQPAARTGTVDHRLAVHVGPQVAIERPELALDRKERPRIGHGRLDLQAITHDTRIAQQSGAPPRIEVRHARG